MDAFEQIGITLEEVDEYFKVKRNSKKKRKETKERDEKKRTRKMEPRQDEAEDFEILMNAFEQIGITLEEVDEYFKVN